MRDPEFPEEASLLRRWWALPWFWRAAGAALAALLLLFLAAAAFVYSVKPPNPDLTMVWQRRSEPSITVLDEDEKLVMTRGGREGPIIPLAEMPPYLWQAFLAVEDKRFYEHGAIDPRGLARAMLVNLLAGRTVQGGSTLTQQLAKNLFLSPERSVVRKVQEAWIAIWLERNLGKDAILTLYLNRVYLGAGCYGVEAAAQYYFGKSARDVSLAEAALLAALPKAPTRLAPTKNLAGSWARASHVLDTMADAGFSTPQAIADARAHPARPAETEQRDAANYYVDWLLDQLWQIPDADEADEWRARNLVVHSTYDRKLQSKAELAVMSVLDEAAEKRNAKQAAIVVLDPSGAVRAMVGGKSYAQSQFNRAVQAKRQPGSTFKPFVYLAALEQGMSPYDLVDDAPITVDGWSPENAEREYKGEITLVDALGHSVNTAAVRISEKVGRANVIETARRLGIESPLEPNPSIALGTSEVNLLELSGAYLPFLDKGLPHKPFGIRSVTSTDASGAAVTLYEREEPPAERVVAEKYADTITAMLGNVVEEGTGTASQLADGRPSAGKTGTSQDYRDAWFIGFTPQLLAGVWVGNDEDEPMDRVFGGTLPARLWKDFMDRALYGEQIAALPTLESLGETGEAPVAENPQNPPAPAEEEEPKCHFLFFRVRC